MKKVFNAEYLHNIQSQIDEWLEESLGGKENNGYTKDKTIVIEIINNK